MEHKDLYKFGIDFLVTNSDPNIPVVFADEVGVKIINRNDNTATPTAKTKTFVSLETELSEIKDAIKKINSAIFNLNNVTVIPTPEPEEGLEVAETEEIDTLQEVYNVLKEYKNTDIISADKSTEIVDASLEDIESLDF